MAAQKSAELALKEKDAALATARKAVDQMLTRTADETLSDVPLAQPLRRALFEDALEFYEGFVAQAQSDPSLRFEMARVLRNCGDVQRDLDRYEDARGSYQRSIDLLEKLVASAPGEFSYRQQLALGEQALAFELQMEPQQHEKAEAEAHYHKVLQILTDLERDFPDRRQPAVLCLRHLAEFVSDRGDKTAAAQLFRQAIARGEQYLAQQPNDRDSRVQLCWCCSDLSGFESMQDREDVLKNGLRHTAILLEQNPRFASARYVDAWLTIMLAEQRCATNRRDEAIPLFQNGLSEMESVCVDSPATDYFWGGCDMGTGHDCKQS